MLKEDSETGVEGEDAAQSVHLPRSTRYPGQNDLLLGRGGETNNHSGNIKFRRLLEEYRAEYRSAPKGKKPLVSQKLVKRWRSMGGRFLAKSADNEDIWEDIGDEAAWRRCSKSLGEQKTKKSAATEASSSLSNQSTPSFNADCPESQLKPAPEFGQPGENLRGKRKRENISPRDLASVPDYSGFGSDMTADQVKMQRIRQDKTNIFAHTDSDNNINTSSFVSSQPRQGSLSGTPDPAITPGPFDTSIPGSSASEGSSRLRPIQGGRMHDTFMATTTYTAIDTTFQNISTAATTRQDEYPQIQSPLLIELMQRQRQEQEQGLRQRNLLQHHQWQAQVQHQEDYQEGKLSEELPTAAELLADNVFTSDSSNSGRLKHDSPDSNDSPPQS